MANASTFVVAFAFRMDGLRSTSGRNPWNPMSVPALWKNTVLVYPSGVPLYSRTRPLVR